MKNPFKHCASIWIVIILFIQYPNAQFQNLNLEIFKSLGCQSPISKFRNCDLIDAKLPHTISVFKNNCNLQSRAPLKQRLDSFISWRPDQTTNQLNAYTKVEYNYNSVGKVLSRIDYYFDPFMNAWEFLIRYDYTYNANGDLELEITQTWNGFWFNFEKNEYVYEFNGLLKKIVRSIWNSISGPWDISYKFEHTNNARGLDLEEISYEWNNITQNWDGQTKNINSYDISDKLISSTILFWADSSQSWKLNNKSEYTYNANQIIIGRTYFDWNDSIKVWLNSRKDEMQYDVKGNLISTLAKSWNSISNTWEFIWNYENYFDFNYSLQELITPFLDNPSKLLSTKILRYQNNKWLLRDSSIYYYSDLITGNSNLANASVHLYPNPASEYVICSLNEVTKNATLELIDLFGKKVLSQRIQDKVNISVAGLSKGLYIYQIKSGQNVYKGKLLVE